MPELPEVETLRRGLGPLLVGRGVRGVRVHEARLRRPVVPRELRRLCGARIKDIRRRSKYLLLDTDAGLTLLIHLGMSGRLRVVEAGMAPRPHEHVVIALDDGRELRFSDPRRFGLLRVVMSARLGRDPSLAGLGPEPLDRALSADFLFRSTRGRRVPIKNYLMNTRAVAGVGNIYACEALHRAAIHPKRAVGRIGRAAWAGLLASLREVLEDAIRAGGTTLRDFANAAGEAGYFAVSLRVYDRAGAPCGRCGASVRRIVQAGRSTFYCPRCQR